MDHSHEMAAAIAGTAMGMGAGKIAAASRTLSDSLSDGSPGRDGAGLPRTAYGGLGAADRHAAAVAYAVARMPATFAAARLALAETLRALGRLPEPRPAGVARILSGGFAALDAGAGTGASAWACEAAVGDVLGPIGGGPRPSYVCLERSAHMAAVGSAILGGGTPALRAAEWVGADFAAGPLGHRGDLVVASYVLNEVPRRLRARAALSLWEAASGALVLVEPGTPAGYGVLMEARAALLGVGARMAAPCPNGGACPIDAAAGGWCRFTRRVARGRLHLLAKAGEAPYEDERFAFVSFYRDGGTAGWDAGRAAPGGTTVAARVIRHPKVGKGCVWLKVCAADGIGEACVRRRDGEAYAAAKKCGSGDLIALPAQSISKWSRPSLPSM